MNNNLIVGTKVKVIKITSMVPTLQELMAHLVGMVGTATDLITTGDNHTVYYVQFPNEFEVWLFARRELMALEEVNE